MRLLSAAAVSGVVSTRRVVPRAPRLVRLVAAGMLGALAGLLVGARALAQEVAADEPAVGGGVAGYGTADWLNLVLRLGLVLLVIWAAIVAMRWWMRRMNGMAGGDSGRVLEVLESRPMGPNRSLQLVRLGNRAVLLGVTAERINAVLEVTDPVEVERLAARPEPAEPTSFRDTISRLGALTRRGAERASDSRMTQGGGAVARSVATPRGGVSMAGNVAAVARESAGARVQQRAAAPVQSSAGGRGRWMTLMRWVIGLEGGPRGSQRPVPVATAGAARTAATMGRVPITGVPPRVASGARDGGARLSPAERATLAAELPASRASRARSGYRQNQIAEAQRAINAVRELRSS